MRWLTLYARSRQMPASLAAVLVSALAVGALARSEGGGGGEGPGEPQLAALTLAAAVAAASLGLGGQDRALDRTAAIRWRPRRAAHVLLAGAVVAAAPPAVQTMGADLATTAFLVRDGAGLMGLAALGAVVCGRRYAWTVPLAWLSLSLFAPPPGEHADAGGDLDAGAARHGGGHLDGRGPHGRRHRALRPRGSETLRPGRPGRPGRPRAVRAAGAAGAAGAYFDSTCPSGSGPAASASRAVCQAESPGWSAERR